MHIRIVSLQDEYHCDTCGWTDADGAQVFLDGKEAFTLEPKAHCYDGTFYSDADIYRALLKHLGYTVEID